MAEVIQRKFPDEYNLASKLRGEHLDKHIKNTLELINKYETILRESDDPKEKARCQSEIVELRNYLDEYTRELEEMKRQGGKGR
jgi:hypothetical protein